MSKEGPIIQKNQPQTLERKGAQPIRACIVDRYNTDAVTEEIIKKMRSEGVDVDYYAEEHVYEKNNMKNAGSLTYVISGVDEKSKYSNRYANCTGVVVVGKDEKGKEISFLSHQDPTEFLVEKNESFVKDLKARTQEIVSKANKDSIDAIILGGNYGDGEYIDSVKMLGETLKKELGFEPTVITGPHMRSNRTDVYFDTENRRLYIVRPEQRVGSRANEHYLPSEIEKKREDW